MKYNSKQRRAYMGCCKNKRDDSFAYNLKKALEKRGDKHDANCKKNRNNI